MKKFDLKAAKAGAKVVTRDGNDVRIICFDRVCESGEVVALITHPNESEYVYSYNCQGESHGSALELFMAPVKKEGWINIYRHYSDNKEYVYVHSTEQAALEGASQNCSATVKITWEE